MGKGIGGWDQATPGTHPPTKLWCLRQTQRPWDPRVPLMGKASKQLETGKHRGGREDQGRRWYPKTTA